MTKQKILIIEDEEVLLDVLKTKLKKKGYEVFAATNGEEGIEFVKKHEPDLILLDIIMPKIDGYGVLEWLHSHETYSKIPTIIISNSGQPVEIDRALALGAIDYLIKAQFEPDEVLVKVTKALKQNLPNESIKKTLKKPVSFAAHSKRKTPTGKKRKVLIVEDDLFLRELISRKLINEGYIIVTATDGKEGYEAILSHKPDLVLLDIILPIRDGFEVLKQVRTHSNTAIAKLPIILLSNLGQDSDIEKGKKLGANDYLIKSSFTTDQIVTKIKQYI